jgi:excisionase family DNA binding protein
MLSFFIVLLYLLAQQGDNEHMTNEGMWLTIDELSIYLKMGKTKLYRMVQNGEIPASKIHNQWRFNREEVDDWMKRQRPRGTKPLVEGAK